MSQKLCVVRSIDVVDPGKGPDLVGFEIMVDAAGDIFRLRTALGQRPRVMHFGGKTREQILRLLAVGSAFTADLGFVPTSARREDHSPNDRAINPATIAYQSAPASARFADPGAVPRSRRSATA